MIETIISKTYSTFCAQPERDFIINLCITGDGFRVIVTDHAGSVETESISFADNHSILSFFRVVMGLAFLPDKNLGVDMTITRRNVRPSSGTKFGDQYRSYANEFSNARIDVLTVPPSRLSPQPMAVTSEPAPVGFDKNISTITIGCTIYRVVAVIFESKSLIGRSTKVYLVEQPDGRRAVVKDNWIMADRLQEATILQGLTIPFGPNLLKSIILGNTTIFEDRFDAGDHKRISTKSVASQLILLVLVSPILPPYGS
jgi:hypothetical protein